MKQEETLLYHPTKPKQLWLVFFSICLLFLGGIYLSLRFGAITYSHRQLMEVLSEPTVQSAVQDVVVDLRMPRILAAILVGAAMAQAGAMMQGITRNAIADPGLLGINAGAGLALILAFAIFGSLHYSQILLMGTSKNTSRASRASNLSLIYSLFLVNFCL